MIGVKVKVDTRVLRTVLSRIETRTVPFAVSLAINEVVVQVQAGERANIQKTFKTPRPFTVRSVLYLKSTWQTMRGVVFIKPGVAKYLAPFEYGGRHVLPGPALLNPKAVRLDQYSQLTQGAVKRLAGRQNVFFATIGGVSGFYLRMRGKKPGIKLLLALGNALPVREHLDFVKRGKQIVAQVFPPAFTKAFATAMASLRIPKTP